MISYSISTRPRGGQTGAGSAGLRQTLVERIVKETQTGGGGSSVPSVGLLANALLTDGMNAWHTRDTTRPMRLGTHFVLAPGGGKVISRRGPSGRLVTDGRGRHVLRIYSSSIWQEAAEMLRRPTLPEAGEGGAKSPVTVYFAMMVRCLKPGTLTVAFEEVETQGYTTFTPMQQTLALSPTDDYTLVSCQGLWNGTGRLRIATTGEVCVYMFILTEEKADSTALHFYELMASATALTNTLARHFDGEGRVRDASDIVTTEKCRALISEHLGRRTAITLTDANVSDYIAEDEEWGSARVPRFEKMLHRLVFRTSGRQTVCLPGLRADTSDYTAPQCESARCLIDTRLLVYCNGPGSVTFTGAVCTPDTTPPTYADLTLSPGEMAALCCTLAFDAAGTECIHWTARRGHTRA